MKSPPKRSGIDVQSSLSSPDYDVAEAGENERSLKKVDTDFQRLKEELGGIEKRHQRLTLTDMLIDVFTPLMIFCMVVSIVWFLLDVRFIFTETYDPLYRIVGFCLVMGVVALNRLIARDGAEDSLMYIIGLVTVTILFTFMITAEGGSVAGDFMDADETGDRARGELEFDTLPFLFNSITVAFLWWLSNRLTHECCVDENHTAGDIGILTGTMRNFKKSIQPVLNKTSGASGSETGPEAVAQNALQRKKKVPALLHNEVTAFDPMEWQDPDEEKYVEVEVASSAERLNKRHPGVSIFYFAVPTMLIFALGLPVLRQGGRMFEFRGHFYVAVFTLAALALLMMTSLGGLRAYFRQRRIHFPAMIGIFWCGLGAFMILIVMLGSFNMPMPAMPPMAYIGEHETDYWTKTSTFELEGDKDGIAAMVNAVDQSNFIQELSLAVLVSCILFMMYGAVRGLLLIAGNIGRNRQDYPPWVVRFFDRLDQALQSISQLPSLPKRKLLRIKIRPDKSYSFQFQNPMKGDIGGSREKAEAYIAYAYDAMCALAYDMGVPREKDQTPYEFLKTFPKEMKPIFEEAEELTILYVKSAYSNFELDEKVLDRVRKFWLAFEALRNKYTVRSTKS
jgi:hypothetical protein